MWAVVIRKRRRRRCCWRLDWFGIECLFFPTHTSGLNECPKWEKRLWKFGRSAIFGPSSPSATPGLALNTDISTTGIRDRGNLGEFVVFKVHFTSKVSLILALSRRNYLFINCDPSRVKAAGCVSSSLSELAHAPLIHFFINSREPFVWDSNPSSGFKSFQNVSFLGF